MTFTVCVVSSQPGDGKSYAINRILNASLLPSGLGVQSVTTMVTIVKHHDAEEIRIGCRVIETSDLKTDELSGRFEDGVLDGIVSGIDSWIDVQSKDCASTMDGIFETNRIKIGASRGASGRKRSRPAEGGAGAGAGVGEDQEEAMAGHKIQIAVVLTRSCPAELCMIEIPDGVAKRTCYATLAGGCDAVLWCSARLLDMNGVMRDYVQRCVTAYSPAPFVPQVLACSMRLWTAEDKKFDDGDMRDECTRNLRRGIPPLESVHGGDVFMRDSAESILRHCTVMDMKTAEKATLSVERLFANLRAAKLSAAFKAPVRHEGVIPIAWPEIKLAIAEGETSIIVWMKGRMGDCDFMDDDEKEKLMRRVWERFVRSSVELVEAKAKDVLRQYCVHALARILGVDDCRVVRRGWDACKGVLEEVDYKPLVSEVFGKEVKRLIEDVSSFPAAFFEGCEGVEAVRSALEPAIQAFVNEVMKQDE